MKHTKAFPLGVVDEGKDIAHFNPGMDLRDYFAAKAMQGTIEYWTKNSELTISDMCRDAYLIADNMITARENEK